MNLVNPALCWWHPAVSMSPYMNWSILTCFSGGRCLCHIRSREPQAFWRHRKTHKLLLCFYCFNYLSVCFPVALFVVVSLLLLSFLSNLLGPAVHCREIKLLSLWRFMTTEQELGRLCTLMHHGRPGRLVCSRCVLFVMQQDQILYLSTNTTPITK